MRRPSERFRYEGWSWADGELTCTYTLDDLEFTETFELDVAPDVTDGRVAAAARLVFLLAGISYYKAGAPPPVDLVTHADRKSGR